MNAYSNKLTFEHRLRKFSVITCKANELTNFNDAETCSQGQCSEQLFSRHVTVAL